MEKLNTRLSIKNQKINRSQKTSNTKHKIFELKYENTKLLHVQKYKIGQFSICSFYFFLISWHYIEIITFDYQKLPPEVFCKKDVLRNFAKFTGEHMCRSLFFNKVAGLSLGPSDSITENSIVDISPVWPTLFIDN